MLVVKSKYQKHHQYIVGKGLARINPMYLDTIPDILFSENDQGKSTCCSGKISTPPPISNSVASKALSNKSKEFLEALKKSS